MSNLSVFALIDHLCVSLHFGACGKFLREFYTAAVEDVLSINNESKNSVPNAETKHQLYITVIAVTTIITVPTNYGIIN